MCSLEENFILKIMTIFDLGRGEVNPKASQIIWAKT